MRPMEEMTIEEMREESRSVYDELQRRRLGNHDEESADELTALSERWQALDAEVHRRMMEDDSLAGAIYRANGGYLPAPKRTI